MAAFRISGRSPFGFPYFRKKSLIPDGHRVTGVKGQTPSKGVGTVESV